MFSDRTTVDSVIYTVEGSLIGHCLYCIVMYYTVLHCIVLYCTILYSITKYCTVQYNTVLYSITLYCTVTTGWMGLLVVPSCQEDTVGEVVDVASTVLSPQFQSISHRQVQDHSPGSLVMYASPIPAAMKGPPLTLLHPLPVMVEVDTDSLSWVRHNKAAVGDGVVSGGEVCRSCCSRRGGRSR